MQRVEERARELVIGYVGELEGWSIGWLVGRWLGRLVGQLVAWLVVGWLLAY